MLTVTEIKECKECGLKQGDFADGFPLRGIGDICITCGSPENWIVVCFYCGNEKVYDEHVEQVLPQCPSCGKHMSDANITLFDSGYIINTLLKRPDLHKERTWIPAYGS